MISMLFNVLCIGTIATFGLTCTLIHKLCRQKCRRRFVCKPCIKYENKNPKQRVPHKKMSSYMCLNTSETIQENPRKRKRLHTNNYDKPDCKCCNCQTITSSDESQNSSKIIPFCPTVDCTSDIYNNFSISSQTSSSNENSNSDDTNTCCKKCCNSDIMNNFSICSTITSNLQSNMSATLIQCPNIEENEEPEALCPGDSENVCRNITICLPLTCHENMCTSTNFNSELNSKSNITVCVNENCCEEKLEEIASKIYCSKCDCEVNISSDSSENVLPHQPVSKKTSICDSEIISFNSDESLESSDINDEQNKNCNCMEHNSAENINITVPSLTVCVCNNSEEFIPIQIDFDSSECQAMECNSDNSKCFCEIDMLSGASENIDTYLGAYGPPLENNLHICEKKSTSIKSTSILKVNSSYETSVHNSEETKLHECQNEKQNLRCSKCNCIIESEDSEDASNKCCCTQTDSNSNISENAEHNNSCCSKLNEQEVPCSIKSTKSSLKNKNEYSNSIMKMKRKKSVSCSALRNNFDSVLIDGEIEIIKKPKEPLKYIFQTEESKSKYRIHELRLNIKQTEPNCKRKYSEKDILGKYFIKIKIDS